MSLAEDAKAAKKAGMTYGKYMASRAIVPVYAPRRQLCKWCGAILGPKQDGFCTSFCRQDYNANREAQKRDQERGMHKVHSDKRDD